MKIEFIQQKKKQLCVKYSQKKLHRERTQPKEAPTFYWQPSHSHSHLNWQSFFAQNDTTCENLLWDWLSLDGFPFCSVLRNHPGPVRPLVLPQVWIAGEGRPSCKLISLFLRKLQFGRICVDRNSCLSVIVLHLLVNFDNCRSASCVLRGKELWREPIVAVRKGTFTPHRLNYHSFQHNSFANFLPICVVWTRL